MQLWILGSIWLIVFKVLFFLWTELDPGFFLVKVFGCNPLNWCFIFLPFFALELLRTLVAFFPWALQLQTAAGRQCKLQRNHHNSSCSDDLGDWRWVSHVQVLPEHLTTSSEMLLDCTADQENLWDCRCLPSLPSLLFASYEGQVSWPPAASEDTLGPCCYGLCL